MKLLGLWNGFRKRSGGGHAQDGGKYVQRHREAWVGPIREPVMRDGAGKRGKGPYQCWVGDCGLEPLALGPFELSVCWWLGRE